MKRSPSETLEPAKEDKKNQHRGRPGKSWPVRLFLFLIKLFLAVHIVYIGITSLFIFVYKYNDPSFIVLMPYRSIGYKWELQKPQPVKLESIPSYIRSMLVAVEDGKFYEHQGIDIEAFKRAREVNARLGKPLYGGSTLTMQVARTLFLVPEKSYVRKYFEVIAALELDLILSKERILELYLGYAEWGKGIFGIETAAEHYYRLPTRSLDRDQAARLIALLSSPIKYSPFTLGDSAILRERYAYLTRRFVSPYAVSPDQSALPESPPGALEPGFEDAFVEQADADDAQADAGAIVPATEAGAGAEVLADPDAVTDPDAPAGQSEVPVIDESELSSQDIDPTLLPGAEGPETVKESESPL